MNLEALPSYEQLEQLEQLPPVYHPALHTFDIVLWKPELQSPFKLASDRSWRIVIAEINSTQMNIYQMKDLNSIHNYLEKLFQTQTVDHQKYIKSEMSTKPLIKFLLENSSEPIPFQIVKPYLGVLRQRYTLQGSSFGSATDYHKKRYTLRLRCEIHQFLFSFLSIERFVNFFADMKTGSILSLPIEDREDEKSRTLPTDISRFRVENFGNFYTSLSGAGLTGEEENLPRYRRNTIDASYCHFDADTPISTNTLPIGRSFENCEQGLTKSFGSTRNDYIDDFLIFSLACIKNLEAKKGWKGSVVLAGDFNHKNLSKFKYKSKNYSTEDKFIVDVDKFDKFTKLAKGGEASQHCKRFLMIGSSLVEDKNIFG